MKFKTTQLRDAITFALVAGAVSATGTGAAFAQSEQEATTLDRIEVTGSRIRSVDAESSQPVLVLDRAAIEKQGLTSVAEVLQRISANGANINRTFNNGGDGSSTVSLRNLGASRTLVLVDGRRWVQGLGGSVDLNTIPSAMIERIEVLKDGASSIYGSDAIAGVVNIITRRDYEGAEARVYYGQFSEGDGERAAVEATLGAGNDRSNVVISLSRVEEKEVSAGDREISRVPSFRRDPVGFSGFSSNGRIWNNGVDPDNVGGPGSNSIVIRPGATGTGPANDPRYALGQFQPFAAGQDAYNFAADNYLLTPQTRTSLYMKGRHEITDNVSFVADALYNERRSEQQLAGFPLNGGVSNNDFMSGDSYYNPYNTLYGGDGRAVAWSHRLTEQERVYQQNVKTFHVYAGLEGNFEFADRFFNWDVGYNFNRSDQEDAQIGDVNVLNVRAGVGPSELRDGRVVCVDAPGGNIIDGCVPFNPLSPAGGVTQEMLDFLLFTAQDAFQGRSESFTANISGEIVELPGGMMGFAAGVESRKESGFDRPDAFVAAGFTSGNSRQPTSGAYDLDEIYAEVLIPLLADVTGADLLEFSLASRYSDYSNFGDTTNSKAGFKWKPVESLLVRGNWAEGFRAPPISTLFGGQSDSFISFGDICSEDFSGRTATIAANCAAAGAPVGFIQQTNAGFGYDGQTLYPFQVGGNPNVGPEESVSKTLGLVFSPSFVENLNLSLDWWSIEIENAITTLPTAFIVEQCYAAGDQALCDLITRRTEDFQIGNVALTPQNLSVVNVEGYDFNVSYRMPETEYGSFGITLDTSYVSKYEQQTTAASEVEQFTGRYLDRDPYWRLRGNVSLDWQMGDFGATFSSRYFSSLVEPCAFGPSVCSDPDRRIATGPAPRNKLGATTYHDAQVRYNLPWDGTIKAGVTNLFDKEPPVSYTTFANSFDPQYDVPGRFMYMEYIQRF